MKAEFMVWTPAMKLDAGLPALKQSPLEHVVPGKTGEKLEFGLELDERERELSFPIPRLEGMDELHVVRAAVEVAAAAIEQDPLAVAAPSGNARVVALADDDLRVGGLKRVVFEGLVVEGAPASGWVLSGSNQSIHWRGGDPAKAGHPADCKPLRVLARLKQGAQFGPPIAAAPAFPMPGDPGGLYGDALAGASLALSLAQGKVSAVLSFSPPLEARAIELRITVVPEADSLPNLADPIRWHADTLNATWTTKLRGLEVDARVPAMPSLSPAPVASFPGQAAANVQAIDFSAAARSLLRTAYREQGDPTLALHLKSGSIGRLWIYSRVFDAEYRKFLVDEQGVAIALRGGVERAGLKIPVGLAPARFTLTLDGRFGPAALVAAADSGELDPELPKSGYRVADTLALARWLPLTIAEAARPLTRVSVEGRGAGDCELILALHRGDPLRIGTRYGDPVAIDVPSEGRSRWHRAELGPTTSAPPHPEGVWVVAQVSRGSFWWVGSFADGESTPPLVQRSPDAGASWNGQVGRLRTQVHQHWVDELGHEPVPEPIPCTWEFGPLRTDIRLPEQQTSPTFRGVGLPLLGERELKPGLLIEKPIDRVATLGDTLRLAFDCRRDVDFRILDAVMTYSPWLSKR
ncbi:hypothetical protein ACNOYE_28320 [Nannocystaceae bacterium ST9]